MQSAQSANISAFSERSAPQRLAQTKGGRAGEKKKKRSQTSNNSADTPTIFSPAYTQTPDSGGGGGRGGGEGGGWGAAAQVKTWTLSARLMKLSAPSDEWGLLGGRVDCRT